MVLIWQKEWLGHSSGMRQGCRSQAGSLSGSTDPCRVLVIADVQTCQSFSVRTLIYVRWKTSGCELAHRDKEDYFF